MTKPYFFNTPKSDDRVQITPIFTKYPKKFSTEDNDPGCFSGKTPAPVLFSYDYQYEHSRKIIACPFNSRSLPLVHFNTANNGIFTPFSNFNEFGNRIANIIALPIAGLQLVAQTLLDTLQEVVSLNPGLVVPGFCMAIFEAAFTIALTAWELMATTVRILPTIGSFFPACRTQWAGADNVVGQEESMQKTL